MYCVNFGVIKIEIIRIVFDSVWDRFFDILEMVGDIIVWLVVIWKDWFGGWYISCLWDMEELMNKKDEIIVEDKLKMRLVF